jgi:hypothetical protein
MTRPECGLSDQTRLILWWPVNGVMDGGMTQQQEPETTAKEYAAS